MFWSGANITAPNLGPLDTLSFKFQLRRLGWTLTHTPPKAHCLNSSDLLYLGWKLHERQRGPYEVTSSRIRLTKNAKRRKIAS
jgi:hypothetical protein